MLSATRPNNPVQFFRRFWEGWFSVYLSIFLAVLLVRVFLFNVNKTVSSYAVAHQGIEVKAHELFHASVSHIMNLPRLDVVKHNKANVGTQNELTQN